MLTTPLPRKAADDISLLGVEVASRSIGRGVCPRCGEEGTVVLKQIGDQIYVYIKHGSRWCYIGPLRDVDLRNILKGVPTIRDPSPYPLLLALSMILTSLILSIYKYAIPVASALALCSTLVLCLWQSRVELSRDIARLEPLRGIPLVIAIAVVGVVVLGLAMNGIVYEHTCTTRWIPSSGGGIVVSMHTVRVSLIGLTIASCITCIASRYLALSTIARLGIAILALAVPVAVLAIPFTPCGFIHVAMFIASLVMLMSIEVAAFLGLIEALKKI